MRIHRLILSWQKQNSIAICQQFGLKTGIASYKMQQIEGRSNKYSICIYVVQYIFSLFIVLFSFAFYLFHTVWCGWNVWVLKDYNIGHFHLAMNEMKTILLNIIAKNMYSAPGCKVNSMSSWWVCQIFQCIQKDQIDSNWDENHLTWKEN